jgi:hypothetical protein
MKKTALLAVAVMLAAAPATAQKVEYEQKKEQVSKPAKQEDRSNGVRS